MTIQSGACYTEAANRIIYAVFCAFQSYGYELTPPIITSMNKRQPQSDVDSLDDDDNNTDKDVAVVRFNLPQIFGTTESDFFNVSDGDILAESIVSSVFRHVTPRQPDLLRHCVCYTACVPPSTIIFCTTSRPTALSRCPHTMNASDYMHLQSCLQFSGQRMSEDKPAGVANGMLQDGIRSMNPRR
jgi:hypothetical protein